MNFLTFRTKNFNEESCANRQNWEQKFLTTYEHNSCWETVRTSGEGVTSALIKFSLRIFICVFAALNRFPLKWKLKLFLLRFDRLRGRWKVEWIWRIFDNKFKASINFLSLRMEKIDVSFYHNFPACVVPRLLCRHSWGAVRENPNRYSIMKVYGKV